VSRDENGLYFLKWGASAVCLDAGKRRLYVADSEVQGRVLVFSL